ncbi:MAG: ATP-binding cassette domain-containing protein, partial [Aurantimonas coralicida]
LNDAAMAALARVGLDDRAQRRAGSLSHGEKRQLEIAIALATGARLLLLDEPLAGTGHEESAVLVALMAELKTTHTIVLIEHDMDAVFALADRVSVLVYGRLIATGTAEEVRLHPEVRTAYLGEEEAA